MFAGLAELLARLQVTVLVAEDVHWADEATMEFLAFLASRRPRPLHLVVTFRPEDVPVSSLLPRLSRLAAGEGGLRLVLGPLDAVATAGLVSSMLGGEHLSPEFAAFLHQRTDGVPLAVEETVRLLAGRAFLARRGGQWIRRPLDRIEVPATIRDAVLDRAARLGPDARAVLRAVAVLAGPADETTVRSVADISPERTRAGLSQALDCGLLAEDTRGLISFRHALAAQAVYETIPGPGRRVMHLRAGRALEGVSPLPVALLARHFREARDTARWCRYAEQAADLALATGDEATAGLLLYDVVTRAGLPGPEMARLVNKMLLLAFAGDGQLKELAHALRAAVGGGHLTRGEGAELRFQLGRVLGAMGEEEAAHAELERAIPGLPEDSVQATWAMTVLGWPRDATCPASVRGHLGQVNEGRGPRGQQPLQFPQVEGAVSVHGELGNLKAAPAESSRHACRAAGRARKLLARWPRSPRAGRRRCMGRCPARLGDPVTPSTAPLSVRGGRRGWLAAARRRRR